MNSVIDLHHPVDSYAFGSVEGWDAFDVARFESYEEISRPFRFDITLIRESSRGAIDTEKLTGTGATFLMTHASVVRAVHGVIFEMEELDRTREIILYRVRLAPHFLLGSLRRRSRNFVDTPFIEILSAVLENESPRTGTRSGGLARRTAALEGWSSRPTTFTEPTGFYRWEARDQERIRDEKAYPYVAQYMETDFDFISRMLEREGFSYYFEHGQGGSAVVITDAAFGFSSAETEREIQLRRLSRGHASDQLPMVRSLRRPARLRPRSVTVRDFDYLRSRTLLEAKATDLGADSDYAGEFEFPAYDESEREKPADHQARIRLERIGIERRLREGVGNVRTLDHGRRVVLRDADGIHDPESLLIVAVEKFAAVRTPEGTILDEEAFGLSGDREVRSSRFESRFHAVIDDIRFRPAMETKVPTIAGVQTARVTAEEFTGDRPVINADSLGRVRLRFPWDERPDRDDRRATSQWVRVSQYWAGQGYGAQYTPRVGHEVLVAYHEGNPSRPVIVGRVYNAQNVPPLNPAAQPTKSTLRSQSAVGAEEVDGFNELRFEDRKGKEEIFLHAQNSLKEVVLGSHSTSVGGDQDNHVDGSQSNSVGGHRTHTIGRDETAVIEGDRRMSVHTNEYRDVSGRRVTTIGLVDKITVGGDREEFYDANQLTKVKTTRKTEIGVDDNTTVHAVQRLKVESEQIETIQKRTVTVTAVDTLKADERSTQITATDSLRARTIVSDASASYTINAKDSCTIVVGASKIEILPSKIDISTGAAKVSMTADLIDVVATNINLTGEIRLSGGPITLAAGQIALIER